jgi:serine/threonine protein kinase
MPNVHVPQPDDDHTVMDPRWSSKASPALRSGSATAVDTSSHALPVGTRLHEFEIVSVLGMGGFGIVYVAFDHSLEREVAVKEYMPSSLASRRADAVTVVIRSAQQAPTFDIGLRSFINEARLLAQFDHPALLKVFRFWEDNGTAYMAMPWYRGQTLQRLLEAHPHPPGEAWILALLRPVLGALEVMHAAQCFHRDIAPDNIMVQPNGEPVLLDLGAARRVIGGMTQALTVILKAGYAPIEQYADTPGAKQGPWTDLYALGAVVHQMITGSPPPPSVARLLNDTLVPLSSAAQGRYSASFLQAIDRCLSVKSEGRPQSVAQLRAMLPEVQPMAVQDKPVGAAIAGPTDDHRARGATHASHASPRKAPTTKEDASASSVGHSRSRSRAGALAAGTAVLVSMGLGSAWMLARRAESPVNTIPASNAASTPVVAPVRAPVATTTTPSPSLLPSPDPAGNAAPTAAASNTTPSTPASNADAPASAASAAAAKTPAAPTAAATTSAAPRETTAIASPPPESARKPAPATPSAKPPAKREPRGSDAATATRGDAPSAPRGSDSTAAPPRSAAVEEAERKYVEELNKKLDTLLEDKPKK